MSNIEYTSIARVSELVFEKLDETRAFSNKFLIQQVIEDALSLVGYRELLKVRKASRLVSDVLDDIEFKEESSECYKKEAQTELAQAEANYLKVIRRIVWTEKQWKLC